VRIVVTGGAGFIGSTLVDRLLAEGHDTTAVDDLSTGRMANLARARDRSRPGGARFRFVRADVAGPDAVDIIAREAPEVICHLAAQPSVRLSVAAPAADAHTNVTGTVTVLEAARRAGVRKVVFASSGGSIYGDRGTTAVTERAALAPACPYAAAKVAGEYYLTAFRTMYGLQTTALALANVYGPRQDPTGEAGVIALFTAALLAGRRTQVFGDGRAVRDYLYVDDAVDAFVRALGPAADGRRLNIGTGVGTSVLTLRSRLAELTGVTEAPEHLPARTGEVAYNVLDPSAARRALGWQPFTDLAEGTALTVQALRGTGS
jgi:UDP-glucose 4-epimerase